MNYTEAEAKTKWCPFSRVYSAESGEGSWNRHPHNGKDEVSCIGSACMAWRWNSPTSTETACTEDTRIVAHGHVSYREKPPEGEGWRKIVQYEGEGFDRHIKPPEEIGISTWHRPRYGENYTGHPARGYCGAFGEPK